MPSSKLSSLALLGSKLRRSRQFRRSVLYSVASWRRAATLYSTDRLNWRDLRGFEPKSASEESLDDGIAKVRYYGVSWCHGAPGIALARTALLNMLGNELPPEQKQRLQADLDIAMGTNLRMLQINDPDRVDDLCCGSAGRIDILLECGRLLNRTDWVEQAQSLAQQKLAEWQNGNTNNDAGAGPNYWYQDKALSVAGSELGLFKGMAGWPYGRMYRHGLPRPTWCLVCCCPLWV